MGIYLINRDTLKRLLEEHFPEANDIRSEVIPGAVSLGMKVLPIINIQAVYPVIYANKIVLCSLCCFRVNVTCTKDYFLSFKVKFKLMHLMDTGRT